MKNLLTIPLITVLLFSCGKSPNTGPNTSTGTTSPTNTVPLHSKIIVSTFAGNGSMGLKDGPALSAEFNFPNGMALDATGNLFVADENNNLIRKITPAGVVSTYAGDGTRGFKDGSLLSAEFNEPTALIFDKAGDLFVTDTQNNAIREITPAGVVSTYAGNGKVGLVNGNASAAEFKNPDAMAIDALGNLFVCDFDNNCIREISPGGIVITYAGTGGGGSTDGSALSATFREPAGITIDGSGNLYVADSGNNKIRKITSAGLVSTYAGNGSKGFDNGTALSATFTNPDGITIDSSGNLYITDAGDNEIREVNNGTVSTIAGIGYLQIPATVTEVDGTADIAVFYSPGEIVIDPSGNFYVADVVNNRIRKITLP